MEQWSIEIQKEYFKFSAAHFLIFPDGSAERLHGHNYRVFCELDGSLSEHGLVMDFKVVKPVVRELVDRLDEHFLLPAEHPGIQWGERDDGVLELRYKDAYYAMPREDVVVLPINNSSSENLASWLGRELRRELEQRFPDVTIRGVRLAVEETSGQRGVYRYTADDEA